MASQSKLSPLWATLGGVPDDEIHKVSWQKVTRHFQYDPFDRGAGGSR